MFVCIAFRRQFKAKTGNWRSFVICSHECFRTSRRLHACDCFVFWFVHLTVCFNGTKRLLWLCSKSVLKTWISRQLTNVSWLKKIIWVIGVLRRTVVSQSLTTVLLRTPINQMIFFNQVMLLLGSNHFLIDKCLFVCFVDCYGTLETIIPSPKWMQRAMCLSI